MKLEKDIKEMRSIRRFKKDQILEKLISGILEAARWGSFFLRKALLTSLNQVRICPKIRYFAFVYSFPGFRLTTSAWGASRLVISTNCFASLRRMENLNSVMT
jgi:hypothetical protein